MKRRITDTLLLLLAIMLLGFGNADCMGIVDPTTQANYFLPAGITQPAAQTITVLGVEDRDGSFLLYTQELTWDAQGYTAEYTKFASDPDSYLHRFIQALSAEWAKHGVEASDWQISFITSYDLAKRQITYSTIIRCLVRGDGVILSWGGEHPTFAFEWLLTPLDFDLYAFEYTDDNALRWEGELNSTPTTIMLDFPWPVEHCHYHVWHR